MIDGFERVAVTAATQRGRVVMTAGSLRPSPVPSPHVAGTRHGRVHSPIPSPPPIARIRRVAQCRRHVARTRRAWRELVGAPHPEGSGSLLENRMVSPRSDRQAFLSTARAVAEIARRSYQHLGRTAWRRRFPARSRASRHLFRAGRRLEHRRAAARGHGLMLVSGASETGSLAARTAARGLRFRRRPSQPIHSSIDT
jgi:hypothetical protein